MRELRGQVQPDYRGLTAINRLVKAFESSTGIEVTMEFGKPLPSSPPKLIK